MAPMVTIIVKEVPQAVLNTEPATYSGGCLPASTLWLQTTWDPAFALQTAYLFLAHLLRTSMCTLPYRAYICRQHLFVGNTDFLALHRVRHCTV